MDWLYWRTRKKLPIEKLVKLLLVGIHNQLVRFWKISYHHLLRILDRLVTVQSINYHLPKIEDLSSIKIRGFKSAFKRSCEFWVFFSLFQKKQSVSRWKNGTRVKKSYKYIPLQFLFLKVGSFLECFKMSIARRWGQGRQGLAVRRSSSIPLSVTEMREWLATRNSTRNHPSIQEMKTRQGRPSRVERSRSSYLCPSLSLAEWLLEKLKTLTLFGIWRLYQDRYNTPWSLKKSVVKISRPL